MGASVTPVDPRDIRWELDDPSFRVSCWTSDAKTCRELELAASDVSEVLAWADADTRD